MFALCCTANYLGMIYKEMQVAACISMDVGVCEGLETNRPQVPRAEHSWQIIEAGGTCPLREAPQNLLLGDDTPPKALTALRSGGGVTLVSQSPSSRYTQG